MTSRRSIPAAACVPSSPGKGFGREAIQAGLAFGRARFAPPAFRVTVTTFNPRAQRVVEALGFRKISSFRASADGRSYEILIRPEAGRLAVSSQTPSG